MNNVIVFDLDGVIADWTHRLSYRVLNFDKFLEDCDKDELLAAGATVYNLVVTQCQVLCRAIADNKVQADAISVDVVTCRPDRIRAKTLAWFESSGLLMPRYLHMRADDDQRPHDEIKRGIYVEKYKGKESVLCVFEDREDCVRMWRSEGVECFQTDVVTPNPVIQRLQ